MASFFLHIPTHCNTLQHPATHGNTLQHAATRCNTLQYTGFIFPPYSHTLMICIFVHTALLQSSSKFLHTTSVVQVYNMIGYIQARLSSSFIFLHTTYVHSHRLLYLYVPYCAAASSSICRSIAVYVGCVLLRCNTYTRISCMHARHKLSLLAQMARKVIWAVYG